MEKLAMRRALIATGAILAGVAFAGCGNSSGELKDTTVQKDDNNNDDVRVEYTYTQTGKRVTQYSGNVGGFDLYPALAWCDGSDLMEQVSQYNGHGGSGISRTANHSACRDGMLEPADFVQPE